jgi:hypothetical protein
VLRPLRRDIEPTIDQPLAVLLARNSDVAADAEGARQRRKSRMAELLGSRSD